MEDSAVEFSPKSSPGMLICGVLLMVIMFTRQNYLGIVVLTAVLGYYYWKRYDSKIVITDETFSLGRETYRWSDYNGYFVTEQDRREVLVIWSEKPHCENLVVYLEHFDQTDELLKVIPLEQKTI